MDSMAKLGVKKELVGGILAMKTESFPPPMNQEADSTTIWKKTLLLRDLDLVKASIKIIMAMPSNSKQCVSLGKLIHASLKDVEGVLLNNQIPISRLGSNALSSVPLNSRGNREIRSDVSAYSSSGPWKIALMARDLDLIYTCIHAILLDPPLKERSQLADTTFAALKDLQDIIKADSYSSSQQITKFVRVINQADFSESNAPSTKSCEDTNQTHDMEKHQNRAELRSLVEPENQIVSQKRPLTFEDTLISEEPPNHMPSKTVSPQNLEEPQNIVKRQSRCNFSEQELQNVNAPQNLNYKPCLSVAAALADTQQMSDFRSKILCPVCSCRLVEGRCASCINFALKMEDSMKQNILYECSDEDNSGGVRCKVCRFNLILKFMPDYAVHKKIHVIHKQLGPSSNTTLNENPANSQQDIVVTTSENVIQDVEASERSSPQNLREMDSVDIPAPPYSPINSQDDSSIVISSVSSLAIATANSQDTCSICNSRTNYGKCNACRMFAQRMKSLVKWDVLYECAHENYSGGPKCRVCRYNKILIQKAGQEDKKIVSWNNYIEGQQK